jgi:hypothetical protein
LHSVEWQSFADVSGQGIFRIIRSQEVFLDFLMLEDVTETFPETSVKDYHSTLRDIPEERKSLQHRGGSLKSHFVFITNNSPLHFHRETVAVCFVNRTHSINTRCEQSVEF